jgi:hypothetical protein
MNTTLEECRAALACLAQHGTQEELNAYVSAVFEVALAVAHAGKEGEFLGFGGVALDESEKIYLRDLAQVLGVDWNE